MCGIAGIFRVLGRITVDDVRAVLRMMDAQVHRGPDDWGLLLPEEGLQDPSIRGLLAGLDQTHVSTYRRSSAAPACILGSRRLSIIDLSPRGRMPMGSHDGRIWLTYNGEVYNFRELRAELERLGYVFRSNTDTETVLHGYEEWGEEVLQTLRGMFAIAIFDQRSADDPRLFLAKDRFGMKPLYWARKNGVFHFGSEVRAISAGGLMPDEPEPRGIHGFLMYGSVPTPYTTMRDVFSLPAAHALTIDSLTYSYPTPRRYWSLPLCGSLRINPDEAALETRRLLEESTRLHLVGDVSRGVFLSGGMDSSTITALAARHSPDPLVSLCVTFDETHFSEGPYAARVAERFGCKHIEVRLRDKNFLQEIPQILDTMDQPSIDGVNVYFIAKAAKAAGLTSVLSGLGGDEIFWGYPGFRRGPRLFRWTRFPGARACARLIAAAGQRLGYEQLEKLDFLANSGALSSYLTIRGLYPPAKAARLLGAGVLPIADPGLQHAALGPSQYAEYEAALYLQNQLLRDSDIFGMAHSVEVRVPFLDHRLAEFVASLPENVKKATTINKPLLYAAIGKDMMPEAATRPKAGFTLPFERWMRDHHTSIRRQTEPGTAINPKEADLVWNAFRKGRVHWSRPWAVTVLNGMSKLGTLRPLAHRPYPKRILFILPEVYASKGGILTYSQHLLRAVAESFPRTELRAISMNDTTMPSHATAAGRVHFTGCGPRQSIRSKMRLILTTIRETLRHPPELVICGHIHLAPITLLLSLLCSARITLVAYGIEVWEPRAILRWAAKHMHQILSISRFTADKMAAWGIEPKRVHILPPSVDGEVFRPLPNRRTGGPLLLTIARLNASEGYKGVDRVIQALHNVVALHPHVRYVVAGQGDDLPRLEVLAKALGLARHVTFKGHVSDRDLLTLFNEADLFVMPSRNEGFGIVFLEALACGLPAIAGNGDGSVEALLNGRTGLLINPDNSDQVTQAIRGFLERKMSALLLDSTRLRDEALANYGFDHFRERVSTDLSTKHAACRQ